MEKLTRQEHSIYLRLKELGKVELYGQSIWIESHMADLNEPTTAAAIRRLDYCGCLSMEGNRATGEIYRCTISWAQWLYYEKHYKGYYAD